MCCFTGDVAVSRTEIFARDAGEDRQWVVYSMQATAASEVAMVLPLPVAPGSGDQAVAFTDLSGCPRFFHLLHSCFDWLGLDLPQGVDEDGNPIRTVALPVQEVGDFEASYVPGIADFARLDARFRLSPALWNRVPAYRDFGFAVFKLKPGTHASHPLALNFPRADPRALFFPTVHVHDGAFHDQAGFDHLLYAQVDGRPIRDRRWFESERIPRQLFGAPPPLAAMVDLDQHLHLQPLQGQRPNQDTILALG